MAAADAITDKDEMILVNDGSPDDSLVRALDLQATDARVVVLDLARNFGHHKAMMTGLDHATGDLVFLIDSDLEEPPELLTRFYAELVSGDWDVVYGVQGNRRGGAFERVSGAAFYSLVNLLSDQPLPRNLVTVQFDAARLCACAGGASRSRISDRASLGSAPDFASTPW